MIQEEPADHLLERFYSMPTRETAAPVWRAYVETVRRIAGDPSESTALRAKARALLGKGLDPDAPPPRPDDVNDDPEGFGMDEPAEGDVQ